MASITTTVTAITEMVRGRMTAVPLDAIVGQPTLPAVRKLVEKRSAFALHFHTTAWGERHGHLALVLDAPKMRVVTDNASLDCTRLTQPNLVHLNIKQDTKGRKFLQFQEDQK